MDQRISFITLPVRDRDASRRFYLDGLGWSAELDVEDVIMIRVGDRLMLSLWEEESFVDEIGARPARDGVPPLTLAHNVATKAEVDDVLATAKAGGASEVAEAEEREWGGYSGYFADPDGYRWEIAFNPGAIGESVLP